MEIEYKITDGVMTIEGKIIGSRRFMTREMMREVSFSKKMNAIAINSMKGRRVLAKHTTIENPKLSTKKRGY